MKILFICTAHNSLSQRLALALQERGHAVTVEMALSSELMIEAAEMAQPDLILCPFLTKRVPAQVYSKWLTLIVHPGAPGDAGPSAIDLALFGDTGELDNWHEQLALIDYRHAAPDARPRRRSHWAITVLQAIEALDAGPIVAFEQFEMNEEAASMTKSDLYRGPISQAAVRAVFAAIERLETHCTARPFGVDLPLQLSAEARSGCVSRQQPFLGGPTHERPLFKASARDFVKLPASSTHKLRAEVLVQRINSADSQPGVQSALLGPSMFLYGAHLQSSPLPENVAHRAAQSKTGTILATRAGAVLMDCGADFPLWITHLRRPKAKVDKHLHPKLPSVQAIESDAALAQKLELAAVPEWPAPADHEAWAFQPGTWQQVWVDIENAGQSTRIAYVYFEFYNGATATGQCHELAAALEWTLSREPKVHAVVLMGGAGYFSNGIALNVIEGSEDPAAESWANINAIDDVVEKILAPSGVLTISALRGNAAAGGLALGTAADICIASAGATFNPHYRGLGLYGSEWHTYSWPARCGTQKARELTRSMMPMSAKQALQCGLVDHVVGSGHEGPKELETLIKNFVEAIVTARAEQISPAYPSLLVCGAPWTKQMGIDSGFECKAEPDQTEGSHARSMLQRKQCYLALLFASRKAATDPMPNIPDGFATFRKSELDQMRLDFFHPVRSHRYHSRRLAFVRKLVPKSTPTRFALHRRVADGDWSAAEQGGHLALDEEEQDAFDSLGDVPDDVAVARMPTPTVRVLSDLSRSTSASSNMTADTASTSLGQVAAFASRSSSGDCSTPATSTHSSPKLERDQKELGCSSVLQERERDDASTAITSFLSVAPSPPTHHRRATSPSISFDDTAAPATERKSCPPRPRQNAAADASKAKRTSTGARRLSASNFASPFLRKTPSVDVAVGNEAPAQDVDIKHVGTQAPLSPRSKGAVSRLWSSIGRSGGSRANGVNRASVLSGKTTLDTVPATPRGSVNVEDRKSMPTGLGLAAPPPAMINSSMRRASNRSLLSAIRIDEAADMKPSDYASIGGRKKNTTEHGAACLYPCYYESEDAMRKTAKA
ncbi:hydrogenase maturation factor hoxx [Ceraceosorus bombacis]|uniref:Hydrogenase maturation factor hoxx n=1 Tax=Ceraceosorus bombacis TaxID=401625 RepID=A0A0P1BG46_9BASI|nr:hydrogenase maturation factor hoxx [Ceraceosorus bombacis]